MSDATSVYLYYDRREILIYVGMTGRGEHRQSQHTKTSEWWPYVARQDVEHHRTRVEAALREKFLIQDHHPPFNRQHNPQHPQLREAYMVLFGQSARRAAEPGGLAAAPIGGIDPEPRCGHCSHCTRPLDEGEERYPCLMLDEEESESCSTRCEHCGKPYNECFWAIGRYDNDIAPDAYSEGLENGSERSWRLAEILYAPQVRADCDLRLVVDARPDALGPMSFTWGDRDESLLEMERAIAAEGVTALVDKVRANDPWARGAPF